jgi:hypothetical protein
MYLLSEPRISTHQKIIPHYQTCVDHFTMILSYYQLQHCAGGGAALGLLLPGHPRSFEFELKSAKIFFSSRTLQLSDTANTVCSFRKQLSKLKNELSRESYCTRYLAELHGDESQTLLLCNAYSTLPLLACLEKVLPRPKVGREHLVDSFSFQGPVL